MFILKKKYKTKAHIKARPTDRKSTRLIEKDNLQTVSEFLFNHFETIDGVQKEDVKLYLEKLNEPA